MKRSMAIALLTCLASLGLAACAGRVPATHYYLLEPPDVSPAGPRPSGATIGVRPFRVDPPYDRDRIVYRVGADSAEVGFYAYHRWAAPLERMLPRVAAATFADLPGVRGVEPAVSGRRYDAQLHGRVHVFEEIDTADGQRVRVELSLTLVRDDTELWSQTVVGEDELSTEEVGRIVESMRAALNEALESARAGLAGAVRAVGDSP